MPTNAQRAILGGATALNAIFKGRIEALRARQSMLLGAQQQEQAQEKIDVNKIFADAQMLQAQTQAKKQETSAEDPIVQLKNQLAMPLLHKVNTVGLSGLSDRELELYYGLLDIKPSQKKGPPEINDLSDLIGSYTAGNISDEDFLKGTELFDVAKDGSAFSDLFLSILRAHPGKVAKTVPASTVGVVTTYETKDVPMDLHDIVVQSRDEADRQIREGHPGQLSKHFREVIHGDYDPVADDLEAQVREKIEAAMSDPVVKAYMEKHGAGPSNK